MQQLRRATDPPTPAEVLVRPSRGFIVVAVMHVAASEPLARTLVIDFGGCRVQTLLLPFDEGVWVRRRVSIGAEAR